MRPDAAGASLAVDPAGAAVAAVVRERGVRSVINVEPLIEQTIMPLLVAVTVLGACKKGPTDPEGPDGPSNSVGIGSR